MNWVGARSSCRCLVLEAVFRRAVGTGAQWGHGSNTQMRNQRHVGALIGLRSLQDPKWLGESALPSVKLIAVQTVLLSFLGVIPRDSI